jgi:hypothetical protein
VGEYALKRHAQDWDGARRNHCLDHQSTRGWTLPACTEPERLHRGLARAPASLATGTYCALAWAWIWAGAWAGAEATGPRATPSGAWQTPSLSA